MSRPVAVALTLCLAGCVQQQPASQLESLAARVEVTAPQLLQKTPELVSALDPQLTGVATPGKRPLSATSTVTLVPAGVGGVSQVRQVEVAFDISGADTPSVAAAEFVDPSGAPYHRDEAPIGTSSPSADHVEFVLPVAATSIDTNKLTGTWTVRLLVDGQRLSTQNFELTR